MIPSPHAVEMVARLGFDWVLIDCEHGAIELESVELMAMAATNARCVPIGRPSSANPDVIARMMDRGIAGVQVPHVSTPQQAQDVVNAVKYGPEGHRNLVVGTRSARYGFGVSQAEYARQSNADSLVCVQVEDVVALRNLEEIAAVPGVEVSRPVEPVSVAGISGPAHPSPGGSRDGGWIQPLEASWRRERHSRDRHGPSTLSPPGRRVLLHPFDNLAPARIVSLFAVGVMGSSVG